MENWKDIKGYEGKYQVSDLGRVKSLKRWVDDSDLETLTSWVSFSDMANGQLYTIE